MCQSCIDELISLPEVAEAKQRIPAQFKGSTFYSKLDLYTYKTITDDRTCKACMQFDNMIVSGDLMRSYFPYAEIINDDQILVHEHPNCRCTLLRVTNLVDYITYVEPLPSFPSIKNMAPTYTPHKEPHDTIKGKVSSVTLDDLGITLVEKNKDGDTRKRIKAIF